MVGGALTWWWWEEKSTGDIQLRLARSSLPRTMAHLIVEQQPADPFLPRNPKAFGFGATGFHHQHTPFAPSALFASHNHNLPVRTVAATSHKRRLERDDEDDENGYGGGDDDDGRQDRRRRASPTDAMDRSPTPERPRKAAPKRLRMAPAAPGKDKAENKSETDQDVGVLLGQSSLSLCCFRV